MALFMLISSTFAPLKASAGEVENKNEIETIMSQESPQENNENLIEESTPSLSEDIDDSEKEKSEINTNEDVINDEISNKEESKPSVDKTEEDKVLEKTETAELYKDSSYNELLDEDFEIKIKGFMPENAIIKAYMVKDSDFNLKEDRENILSFAYEIFDKNGDIYSQLDSSRYEIEIKSNKFTEDNEIYLYEKGVDELEFEENKNFDFYDKKIRFETTKNQFLIQNKVGVQEEEELEDGQVEDGVEEKKDDKNRKSPVYLEQKEQLKETQTNLETNLINKLIDELLNIDDKLSKNEGSDIVESRKDLIDSLKVNDSDKKEDNDNSASIIELNKDKRLTYQQVLADIYTDRSYSQKAKDQTRIKLSGNLPGFTKVKAYPVEIKIEGQEVLAAYDITIFDEDNNEYKVTSKNDINVQITNQKIRKASEVEVYHKENEFAPEEKIKVDSKANDTVAFKADNFSIYAVTDPEGQNIKFVFFYQDKDGKNIIWDVQNIRNGEKLIQPELPIFSHDGKFEGWYYYDYGNKDKAEEDRFGEKFDFDKAVKVDENSPDVIYLKGKYPDILIINFIDEKKYEKDDGTFGYVDEILSTKEIPAGGTIPSDDIPVIPKDSKTVFSHWSLRAGGKEAFDFSTTITKDFIKSHQQGKNYGELNLYAVYKQALTVSFDSQGGSHVNRQIVYSGDTIAFSDLTKPVKPGYEFKHWSTLPNGKQFNANTPITKDTTLYAVYAPLNVKFTINHMRENPNDDGYSLFKTETRNAVAGTYTNKDSSSYQLPSRDQNTAGMIYDHADPSRVIRGDNGTEINIYYKRKRFVYRIFTGVWPFTNDIVKENVKWGADTSPYFNLAKTRLGGGYTFKEDSVAGQYVSYPIEMPQKDYTLRAWPEGNNEWNVRFIDLDTNDLIRLDKQSSLLSSGVQSYNGDEKITGFTFQYVERPGDQRASPSKTHANGGESEIPEVWVYYKRNTHTLTFSTNGSGADININNVPFASSLDQYVPANYIKEQTTNADRKVFAGWYDNPSGAGNPIDFSKLKMPDNDLKFYAKWDLPTYTVTAYKQRNNPAAGTSEQMIKEGGFVDKSKLSADKPTVAQNTPGSELRWYAFIDGALVEYNFSDPVTSDVYLYPVWLAPVGNELRPLSQIYRVKYRAPASNGSDVIYLDPKEYVNNAEAIIVAPNIDKKYQFPDGSAITMPIDQVFQGWIIDQDSDFTTIKEKEVLNKVYQPGDIINVVGNIMFKPLFNEYKITSVTLKETGPHGEKLPDVLIEKRVHNIKLPDDIKDPRDPEDLRVNDTTILPEAKASNTEGYKFLGWSTTMDGKNGKIFAPGQKVLLTNENIPNILYGIWEEETYNLTIHNIIDGDFINPGQTISYQVLDKDGNKLVEPFELGNGESKDNLPIPYSGFKVIASSQEGSISYEAGEDKGGNIYEKKAIKNDINVTFTTLINPSPPTGLTDNIAPMAIMLALASMAIAYRLYRKNKLAGGIDE